MRTLRLFAVLSTSALLGGCGPGSPRAVGPSGASTATTGPTQMTPIALPPEGTRASSFRSDGEAAAGWYWLQDASFASEASWTFDEVSGANGGATLQIEALARTGSIEGSGSEARFFLMYGGLGADGGISYSGRLLVTLPGVARVGSASLLCRGTVTIPTWLLEPGQALVVVASRRDVLGKLPPVVLPVAFTASGVQVVGGSGRDVGGGPLKETGSSHDAALIGAGAWTGELGSIQPDGSRDAEDWYALVPSSGDRVTLTLTTPKDAVFILRLYEPHGTTNVGKLTTNGRTRTLTYVVDDAGRLLVKLQRIVGEGNYRLEVALSGG